MLPMNGIAAIVAATLARVPALSMRTWFTLVTALFENVTTEIS